MNKETTKFDERKFLMGHLSMLAKTVYVGNNKEEEFMFNEAEHKYFWGHQQMTGVTTITGVLPKFGLAGWMAKQQRAAIHFGYELMHGSQEGAMEVLTSDKLKYDLCDTSIERVQDVVAGRTKHRKSPFQNLITVAQKASKHYLDFSAGVGKKQHTKVENYVNLCIDTNSGVPIPYEELEGEEFQKECKSVKPFIDWAVYGSNDDCGVKQFLESESKVYSQTYFYAGTYDLLYTDNNNVLCLGDYKTSSGIWDSYYAQMGGYQIAREEMIARGKLIGDSVKRRVVVRQGRKNKDFEVGSSDKNNRDLSMFLSALNVYRLSKG